MHLKLTSILLGIQLEADRLHRKWLCCDPHYHIGYSAEEHCLEHLSARQLFALLSATPRFFSPSLILRSAYHMCEITGEHLLIPPFLP